MKNKKVIALFLSAAVLASMMGCQSTQQAQRNSLDANVVDVNDKMVGMIRGVVLTYDPVKVKPEQLKNQGVQVAGSGLVAGGLTGAMLSSDRTGAAIGVGAAVIGGLALLADNLSEPDLVDAYRYTVQTQKGGELLEIYQVDQAPLIEGSPVFVRSYQSGRLTVRLDTTQGRSFQRAHDTQYQGKGRLTAQERQEMLEDAAFDRKLRTDKRNEETENVVHDQYRKAVKTATDKLGSTIDARNQSLRNSKTTNININ
ncbi:acetate kinase (plasmid) [Photobacterium damselae]|uniref:acetate kinase n=1 Tax=Photobacterium damselae TaxID=38293 RepID=UPI002543D29E